MIRPLRAAPPAAASLLFFLVFACSSSSSSPGSTSSSSSGGSSSSGAGGSSSSSGASGAGGSSSSGGSTSSSGGSSSSGSSGGKDSGPPACDEPSCTQDSDCQTISASWRCFNLDAANDKRGCFPEQLIFNGDQSGQPCLDDSSRVTVQVTCTDGKIAVCVPSNCTTAAEQPTALQPKTCF